MVKFQESSSAVFWLYPGPGPIVLTFCSFHLVCVCGGGVWFLLKTVKEYASNIVIYVLQGGTTGPVIQLYE